MKNHLILLYSICLVLFTSCASQSYLDSTTLKEVLAQKEFTFMATRAIPSSGAVTNVLNGTGPSASRILDLDHGYTLEVGKEEVTATLPYFGRAYNASMDPEKQSHRFTSKNFSYIESQGRKNSTLITIRPNDVSHIQRLVLEVYSNGKGYLTIEATDRQLISYDGYLLKSDPK